MLGVSRHWVPGQERLKPGHPVHLFMFDWDDDPAVNRGDARGYGKAAIREAKQHGFFEFDHCRGIGGDLQHVGGRAIDHDCSIEVLTRESLKRTLVTPVILEQRTGVSIQLVGFGVWNHFCALRLQHGARSPYTGHHD